MKSGFKIVVLKGIIGLSLLTCSSVFAGSDMPVLKVLKVDDEILIPYGLALKYENRSLGAIKCADIYGDVLEEESGKRYHFASRADCKAAIRSIRQNIKLKPTLSLDDVTRTVSKIRFQVPAAAEVQSTEDSAN